MILRASEHPIDGNEHKPVDVIVVGAGIAGLVCAIELVRAGKSVTVFEAEPAAGGRVRSSRIEACTIDHGFQVLFTAYPTIMSYLDAEALDLRTFRPAAHVVVNNRVTLIGDALRDPTLLLDAIAPGVIPLTDKLRLLALRHFAKRLSIDECFEAKYTTISTRAFLIARGFSATAVNAFFAPFYGGILLNRTLNTSASVLLFTFKMLSEGDTAVPARGMRAIPEQLAAQLPKGVLRLNTPVRAVRAEGPRTVGVTLGDGREIPANDVVLATDAYTTSQLVSRLHVVIVPRPLGSTSLYFKSLRAPLPGKSLWLNGDTHAIISHTVTLTEVAPEYAKDRALTVATAVGAAADLSDDELEHATKRTLSHFASVASLDAIPELTRIDVQRVPFSQFEQVPGVRPLPAKIDPEMKGLWNATELMHSSSIEGAARGGKMAAMALLGARAGNNG
ncbi:MAG: NAD(P)/FAD-dependent oxidoreductase [Gemmatimonadaceae bacterium]